MLVWNRFVNEEWNASRFIAEIPHPLPVNGIVDGCVGVNWALYIICVITGDGVVVLPVALFGASCLLFSQVENTQKSPVTHCRES